TAGNGDARFLRDVLKCTIAAIAVEDVGSSAKPLRAARHGDLAVAAIHGVAGRRRKSGIEADVVRYEQIQEAIAVVVEEAAAGAPAVRGRRHARLGGDIGEGA